MTTLCQIEDIPDPGSKSLEYEGHALFAVRQHGEVYLYRNRCPHLGIELNWQEDQFLDVEETLIQCATHGALFKPGTGECIAGPCQGDALTELEVRERDGVIEVGLHN